MAVPCEFDASDFVSQQVSPDLRVSECFDTEEITQRSSVGAADFMSLQTASR